VRDAEVGQQDLGIRFRLEQNVFRLDVPMNHVLAVGVLQGIGDVAGDLNGVD